MIMRLHLRALPYRRRASRPPPLHIPMSSMKTRNPNPFPIGIKFGFLNLGGRYKTRTCDLPHVKRMRYQLRQSSVSLLILAHSLSVVKTKKRNLAKRRRRWEAPPSSQLMRMSKERTDPFTSTEMVAVSPLLPTNRNVVSTPSTGSTVTTFSSELLHTGMATTSMGNQLTLKFWYTSPLRAPKDNPE